MVDVKGYGDAVGASANAARSILLGTAPIHAGLAGASGEGGLLATFDAIFQQTMKLEPAATAPTDSAPKTPAVSPVAGDTKSARGADHEPTEEEEEESPPDTPLPSAGLPALEAPEPVAPEEIPVSKDGLEIEVAAAAAVVQEIDQSPEASETAPVKVTEEQEKVAKMQSDDQLPAEKRQQAVATSVQPEGDAEQPAEAAKVVAEPSTTAQRAAPEVEAKVEASGRGTADDPAVSVDATRSEGEPGEKDPGADEPVAVDDGVPEEEAAEQSPVDHRGGRRDRTTRERGGRHRSDQPQDRAVGAPEARASEAASVDRAVDRMVAQMQPVPASESAASPPSGPTPAAPVSLAAPLPATHPAVATTASAEPSAPSESRFSLDGAGESRSVGGIKADAAGEGDGAVQRSSNAEQVRLVQRIARAFQRLGPTGGRVQVMLHPAELGSVRLDLQIHGNRMDARMTAETDAARSILREHLPELRQRLAESGLIVDRVEVEVDARGDQEGAEQGREWQGRDGMEERRDGFASAHHRPRASGSGGQSQVPETVVVRHPRSALDLMA